MQLEYNPLILPFVVSLLVTVGLAIYGFRHYTSAARVFAFTMVALSVWTFCYVMELMSPTLQGKTIWLLLKYLGSGTAPLLFWVFSLYTTNHQTLLKKPVVAGLVGWVLLTWLMVATNSWHHLMWTYIRLEPGFPETQTGHGAFFWVYAVMTYLFIASSVVFYFNFYRTTPRFFKMQALFLFLGGAVPMGGRMTEDFLGLDLIPKVDEVIFFFLFSGILFALALFKYGALQLVPIAHHLVIHNITAGIVVLDQLGRLVDLNPYAQQLLGISRATGVGKTPRDLLEDSPLLQMFTGETQEISFKLEEQDRHFSVQRSIIREGKGQESGHVLVLFDITARREAELALERLARTDALTGVTNRRHFFELAGPEFAQAHTRHTGLALVMLDVDFFKKINDNYGHQTGDAVLRSVASTCRQSLRPTDLFARYGGEEFICMITGVSLERALFRAEQIRKSIEQTPIEVDGQVVRPTISLGVAYLQDSTNSLEELISGADQALYQSKSGGRNRVTVHQPDGTIPAPG